MILSCNMSAFKMHAYLLFHWYHISFWSCSDITANIKLEVSTIRQKVLVRRAAWRQRGLGSAQGHFWLAYWTNLEVKVYSFKRICWLSAILDLSHRQQARMPRDVSLKKFRFYGSPFLPRYSLSIIIMISSKGGALKTQPKPPSIS